MIPSAASHSFNRRRRIAGLVLCLAVPALALLSLGLGISTAARPAFVGAWLLIPAAAIAFVNLHLAIARPWFYRVRHGTVDGLRSISGFPIIGTIFALIAVIAGMGAAGTAGIALGLMVLDTGSPLWFLIMTWRDRGLWDEQR
jgi:hypothetical protein